MTQLPLAVVPDAETQQGKILRALQRGEYLTVAQALQHYHCYALSQRIGELKRMGWPICAESVKTESGARVARYFLARAA